MPPTVERLVFPGTLQFVRSGPKWLSLAGEAYTNIHG